METENKLIEVGVIQKSLYLQIRVTLNSFAGREFLSIREYRASRETGEYYSTSKGFTLPLKGQFVFALSCLLKEAEDIWSNQTPQIQMPEDHPAWPG